MFKHHYSIVLGILETRQEIPPHHTAVISSRMSQELQNILRRQVVVVVVVLPLYPTLIYPRTRKGGRK